MNQSLKFVSLVLPTYNEAQNLDRVIGRIDALLSGSGHPYEIIVVDDDSPDMTWKVAEELGGRYPLRVVRRVGERGLATAVVRGWEAAHGDILAVMDADGQHPHPKLLELINKIEAGADIAVASRHVIGGGVSDWSMIRRILSRGAQILGLVIAPSVVRRVSDPMSGFFALRREVIAGADLNPIGYKILLEVLGRGRYENLDEVGYVFLEREGGDSKVTARLYWEYLQHLVRLSQQTGDLQRFFKFGLVGVSGVVVNLAALWFFKEVGGLPLWLAAVMGVEVAILSNFLFNDSWTFRSESESDPGIGPWFARLVRFNAICAVGAAVNIAGLLVFTNLLGLYYLFAQLLAIGASTIWNYTLNATLNWQAQTWAGTLGSRLRARFSAFRS